MSLKNRFRVCLRGSGSLAYAFDGRLEGEVGRKPHLFAHTVAGGVDGLRLYRQNLRYLLGAHADPDIGAESS